VPRKLRRAKTRRSEVSAAIVVFLETGEYPTRGEHGEAGDGFFELFQKTGDHEAGLRDDWLAVRDEVLEDWHPGTRPWAWWRWDAPRWPRATWPARIADLGEWADDLFAEPRRRLGGIGTPIYECLNYLPEFVAGVPVRWVSPEDVALYSGLARDVLGHPIMAEYLGHHFAGVAPDPHDPPTFESEACYLRRHHLLTPGEEKWLPADAFAPTVITITDDEAPA